MTFDPPPEQSAEQFLQIMSRSHSGDPAAAAELFPLVYEELKKLAAASLAREQPGQTLQPTALVHEAYLRLTGASNPEAWDHRGHFFAAAAVAIRRILIDNARRKHRDKRGGWRIREECDINALAALPEPQEDLLALDEALQKLSQVNPQAEKLVQYHYFAGLTLAEAACVLSISPRTARRLWAFARAWLRSEMDPDHEAVNVF